jgi:hypothetical protein
MKLRTLFLTGMTIAIGWNVFLIHRDQAMFNSYNRCLPVEDCSK